MDYTVWTKPYRPEDGLPAGLEVTEAIAAELGRVSRDPLPQQTAPFQAPATHLSFLGNHFSE